MFWLTLRRAKSRDAQARASAARKLRESTDHRAIQLLINMLDDPQPSVRHNAAISLIQQGWVRQKNRFDLQVRQDFANFLLREINEATECDELFDTLEDITQRAAPSALLSWFDREKNNIRSPVGLYWFLVTNADTACAVNFLLKVMGSQYSVGHGDALKYTEEITDQGYRYSECSRVNYKSEWYDIFRTPYEKYRATSIHSATFPFADLAGKRLVDNLRRWIDLAVEDLVKRSSEARKEIVDNKERDLGTEEYVGWES